MDRITSALLNEFIQSHNLDSLSEEESFEHFIGYLITSKHYSETFSTEDIVVGAGGDCGIDCISIFVNGSLVTEPEEIEDLAENNGYLDVLFTFVQAKRSSSFESPDIGHFGLGVRDFFKEKPLLPQNDRVKHMSKITNEIFSKSGRFRKGNPQCSLYYVTTGKWVNDRELVSRTKTTVEDIKNLNIFRNISFECLGAEETQNLYRASKNAISTEVTFSQRTVFPEIAGVEQAYLGLIPAPEFLKLIENTNEEIITSLFFDNVRDWQQWNEINSEIKQTLEDNG